MVPIGEHVHDVLFKRPFKVSGYSKGTPIAWPLKTKGTKPSLIFCSELVRLIKNENPIVVRELTGVTPETVSRWRKKLKLDPMEHRSNNIATFLVKDPDGRILRGLNLRNFCQVRFGKAAETFRNRFYYILASSRPTKGNYFGWVPLIEKPRKNMTYEKQPVVSYTAKYKWCDNIRLYNIEWFIESMQKYNECTLELIGFDKYRIIQTSSTEPEKVVKEGLLSDIYSALKGL
jgi:hypothetical protein